MPKTRPARRWTVVGALGALDLLVIALAVHAQVDFRHGAGSERSTSLPIVAGFILGFVLLVAATLAYVEARRSVRYRWR